VFGVDFILAYFLFYYVIGNELVNEICLRVLIKKKKDQRLYVSVPK
jgi:hypothetical protein